MNILVQLSHPAHFHLYKNAISQWREDGHQVYVLIKTKDILEDLLKNAGIPYCNILPVAHRKSKLGILWDMLVRDWRMLRFCQKHKIDLLTGSTPEVAQVGWLLRRKVVNTTEDDAHIIGAVVKAMQPFVRCLLSPISCNMGPIENRTIHYPGFHKLAYLHPKRFTADKEVVRRHGINPDKPYFIIRFAKLNAHHDSGVSGISTDIAQHLIGMLSPHGRIYITSERQLEPQFEQYRLQINPLDIHHVMAFATLYIGDSQSMAVEAAMLGVPSLRFNDFVGAKKIGVMEELEHVYGLTYGISSHEPETLYAKVAELLGSSIPDDGADRLALRDEWQNRRRRMLADKIDVTAFLTWFIEHYPQSASETKQADAEFWGRFK